MKSDTWCGDVNTTAYATSNEAREACDDDELCTCIDFASDNVYYTIIGRSDIEPKDGWTALVTLIYKFVHLYKTICL